MNDRAAQKGSRQVEPQKRKRKHSASERARKAKRLTERLDAARADRRVAWPEGQPEFAAERQEDRLAALHGEKRAMRRDIYGQAPDLEGAQVNRPEPRTGS